MKKYGTSSQLVPHGNLQNVPTSTTFSQTLLKKKKGGLCFMATILFAFAFEYICYSGIILLPSLYPNTSVVGCILGGAFNFIFVMVIVAYAKCVTTDPGGIPRHWAFYRGDVHKRRRYCKECNAWKPDRTHHCSACSRCVLNMDHHCPWINNCVGFYNRKFFMQLLLYGVIGLAMIFIHSFIHVATTIWLHVITLFDLHRILSMVSLILAIVVRREGAPISSSLLWSSQLTGTSGFLLLAMSQFAAFHIKLVSRNLTTIENLDFNARESGKYDLGTARNCQQVFGPRMLLWWVPFHTALSTPVGDGVRWTTQTAHLSDVI